MADDRTRDEGAGGVRQKDFCCRTKLSWTEISAPNLEPEFAAKFQSHAPSHAVETPRRGRDRPAVDAYYIGQKMQHALSFMPVKMTDQQVLAVYFNMSGKVDSIANYGIKDGKVFDFVSRTTPTGGSEPDFLKNIMGGLFRFS